MNTEHQELQSPPEDQPAQTCLAETDISQYAILNRWEPSRLEETPTPEPVRPQDEDDEPDSFPLLDYIPALGAVGAVILATCVFMIIGGPAQPAPAQPTPDQPPVQAELPQPEETPRPVFVKEEPGLRVLTEEEKAAMRKLEQELSGSDTDSGSPMGWNAEDDGGPVSRETQAQQAEQAKLQESFSSTYWQGLQDVIRKEKTLLTPLPMNPGLTKAKELLDQRAAAGGRAVAQLDALQPQYVDPQILIVAAKVRNWYEQSLQLVAEARSVFAQGGAPVAEWQQRDAAHRQDFQELLNESDAIRGKLAGKYRQSFGRLNANN